MEPAPAPDPPSAPAGALARGGVRAAIAVVVLAVVWAAAFLADALPFFLTVSVGGVLSGLLGVWVRRGTRGWYPGEAERRRFPTFAVTPRQVALALAVAVVHLGVGHALLIVGGRLVPELTATAVAVYGRAGAVPLWVAVVLGGLITAPLEEVFWRGAVHPLLAPRLTSWSPRLASFPYGALLASTAMYAAFHLATGQVVLVAAAALGGLVWGWLLERTGSVGVPMIAHGAWTTLMLLVPPAT